MAGLRAARLTSVLLGGLVVVIFITAPLLGAPAVVRVAPLILFVLLVSVVAARPWSWSSADWDLVGNWDPSPRTVRLTAVFVGLLVFWFVLTRFQSGEINAIDFTVYYDRPIYQTLVGPPLYVESADDPIRAYRSYFAVHAHWVMLPLALFYLVWPSPLWVLGLSVLAVVAGAVYTLRIVQRTGGGGLVGGAAAVAFVFSDNTARTLNYGFHAEVLYAWFVPWMIHAGLQRRWRTFLIVGLLCVAVKEDAFLITGAVGAALLLNTWHTLRPVERLVILPAPTVLALANLVIYYQMIVPRLSATGLPFYANYWANYGPTAAAAVLGMLRRPLSVVWSTLTSAFLTHVIAPHALLPLIGWRWLAGVMPVVLLYGASTNEQMRSFGIYYAIVLVPFLVLAAADGARLVAERLIADRSRARSVAALAILSAALVAGISNAGYSLRPWKAEVRALPALLRALEGEKAVLVQGGLYPHAGYEGRVQLLTRESLRDLRYSGAIVVLAPKMSAYPMTDAEIAALAALPQVGPVEAGLLAVRGPASR